MQSALLDTHYANLTIYQYSCTWPVWSCATITHLVADKALYTTHDVMNDYCHSGPLSLL